QAALRAMRQQMRRGPYGGWPPPGQAANNKKKQERGLNENYGRELMELHVLGKKIHSGGMKDGEQVIELLVKNPNTAKFISTKLARRFVSDTPPPSLVERMAKTFQKSGGDIREVMRTMIYSPEFWSRGAYRAKVKKPFELVVSSVRALGTDVDTPMPLVQWV